MGMVGVVVHRDALNLFAQLADFLRVQGKLLGTGRLEVA
jgi:hypothetical protein